MRLSRQRMGLGVWQIVLLFTVVSCGGQQEPAGDTENSGVEDFGLSPKDPTFVSSTELVSLLQNELGWSYQELIFSGRFSKAIPTPGMNVCGKAHIAVPKKDILEIKRSLNLLDCLYSGEKQQRSIEKSTLETSVMVRCDGVSLGEFHGSQGFTLEDFQSDWRRKQPCFDAPTIELWIEQIYSTRFKDHMETHALRLSTSQNEACILNKVTSGTFQLGATGCQIRQRWYADGLTGHRKDVAAVVIWDKVGLRHDREHLQGGVGQVKVNNWSGQMSYPGSNALHSKETVRYSMRSDRTLIQGRL